MIHTISVATYLWVGAQVERVDRNESTTEHSLNELVLEWEHLTHLVPGLLATVTP